MGIEILTNELMRCLRGEPVLASERARKEVTRCLNRGAKHTTPNAEKMAGAIALHTDPAGEVHARGVALLDEMLREEEERGPQPWELLCPDPHAGMHRLAEAGIVWAATIREIAPASLGERQAVLVGQLLRLYDLLATPDGDVTGLPGLRANGPSVPRMAETFVYREIRGYHHRAPSGRRKGQTRRLDSFQPSTDEQAIFASPAYWWRRILLRQKAKGLLRGPLSKVGSLPCVLPLELVVQRGEGWTLSYFGDPGEENRRRYTVRGSAAARRDPDHVEDCTSAVLVRWRTPGHHEVESVQTWRTPPPEPPGAPLSEPVRIRGLAA